MVNKYLEKNINNANYRVDIDGLRAIGENMTYNYRAQIAHRNGINNYIGSLEQNMLMLNLLKQGKLIKP